jgi:hypothetical protein
MIETLDDCVGRLVAKIDSLGLRERTLVVFTSDNGGVHVLEGGFGPVTFNAPYRAGKGFLYEGGLRIPLIVRWPGVVPAGALTDTAVISTDWLPTLLALAGLPAPEAIDGVSLIDLLHGGRLGQSRRLFWHQSHYTNQGSRPGGAARDGDWKLIEHYEDGHCELFNVAADAGETNDLSAKYPARVAELRGQLEAWRRAVGAQENRANTDFNPLAWGRVYREIDVSELRPGATAAVMAPLLVSWRQAMDEAIAKPTASGSAMAQPGAGAHVLQARDAIVHGQRLHYEADAAKDTLGFWVDPADFVEWQFEMPKTGVFDVEVLYACGPGSGGAQVQLSIDEQVLPMKVVETGHFQRFVPLRLGTINVERSGRRTLAVRVVSKPGLAVMDLRRITLRAASR